MAATEGEHRVRVAIADHVAEVTLNRPEKHNALDFAMFEAISAAIDEVAARSCCTAPARASAPAST